MLINASENPPPQPETSARRGELVRSVAARLLRYPLKPVRIILPMPRNTSLVTVLIAVGETVANGSIISTGHDLAERYDDTAVALHVVPRKDFEAHKESIESTDEFQDISLSQEQDSAARFARRAVQDSLSEFDADRIEPRGRVGDPAEEIVAAAEEYDPRYLVLGGRRRSPVGKALFGSVTQDVLLEASCPVVTLMTD